MTSLDNFWYDDIIFEVAKHIITHKDLINFMLVCKKFYAVPRINEILWKLRFERDFILYANDHLKDYPYLNYVLSFDACQKKSPWADEFTAIINMKYVAYVRSVKIYYLYEYNDFFFLVIYDHKPSTQKILEGKEYFLTSNPNKHLSLLDLNLLGAYELQDLAWNIGYLNNDLKSKIRAYLKIEGYLDRETHEVLSQITMDNLTGPDKNISPAKIRYQYCCDNLTKEQIIDRFKIINRYIKVF